MTEPMWIAHLSDLHLDALPEVRDRALRVADYLRRLPIPPDAVLVTGDITEPPVLYCPGNSDEPDAFRSLLDARGDAYTCLAGRLHQSRMVGDVGHPGVDDLRLHDAEPLEHLITTHSSVIATVCGHTHGATSTTFAGRPLVIAPGVHSAGQLPLAAADTNRALTDESAPPALALHRVDGGQLVTYFQTITISE